MDAVFSKDNGSLFPSSPVRKSYYCPTTPLRTVETMPTHPHTPTHPHKTTHLKTHWDLITPVVSIATTESVLSNSGSSKFNESWPSNSEVIEVSSAGGVASESCRGSNAGGPPAETLANYVERFRRAPPTDRTTREKPNYSFWWRLDHDHVTPPGRHVTPPRTPQDHSTPDNTRKTCSTSIQVSSLVVPSADDSLDTRSQEVIDKSSSLISSVAAVKYLNSHHSNNEALTIGGPVVWAGGVPTVDSGDDILYQWRLQRRLEVARKEAANNGGEWNNRLLNCPDTKSRRVETQSPNIPVECSCTHNHQYTPSQPHREDRPPPSHHHNEDCPLPTQPHREEYPPPTQPHREEHSPTQLHREERSPPSQHHREDRPPPTQPHREDRPPPSQPHNDDPSLSDFSLDFTTELEPASSQGPITSTAVVHEVIVQRLFGDTPHILTPHTPTPPATPHTLHTPTPQTTPLTSVETRSKSPCEEVPSLPWDHHMDDDLLKTLIKRAQAFEEHIRIVDGRLAAMDSQL